ncbi:hypothetical protein AVEN_237371-1 [Araneus ventricosus]|uniref:(+)RNA virus helicase C-terminal domain-containing protein n=1 Tax=Araneus ventricosus TaxID=182803 RepID=A0A4Y2GTN7_ARAVE|nr:hypothetical protein AVEN_237371-1 [Araneus ventricosus]
MTINKSQGQTFDHVGIYPDEPVFSDGQLYVALSRSRNPNHVKIYTKTSEVQGKLLNNEKYFTRNVVYQELVVNEIVSLDKIMGLEVDNDDINKLVEQHSQELTTEELFLFPANQIRIPVVSFCDRRKDEDDSRV